MGFFISVILGVAIVCTVGENSLLHKNGKVSLRDCTRSKSRRNERWFMGCFHKKN